LKEISDAKNRDDFKQATDELLFAQAEAISTKDPIILQTMHEIVDKTLFGPEGRQFRTMQLKPMS
jgi:hypothetical protein